MRQGRPTAAPAWFPYTEHRTMAEVSRIERQAELAAEGFALGLHVDRSEAQERAAMTACSEAMMLAFSSQSGAPA